MNLREIYWALIKNHFYLTPTEIKENRYNLEWIKKKMVQLSGQIDVFSKEEITTDFTVLELMVIKQFDYDNMELIGSNKSTIDYWWDNLEEYIAKNSL